MLQSPQPGVPTIGFFASTGYRVVNFVCSSSEVVLLIMKHTVIYPSSGPSLEVIARRPVVGYGRSICLTRDEQRT
jgi:hypothetical protein